jgi:hypothetical protein
MPAEKKPTTVTYGDLVDGDIILDKSGNEWLALDVKHVSGMADFWLADPRTKVKAHLLAKIHEAEVTVLRVESHAAEVERLEAEFPGPVTEMERTGESVEVESHAAELARLEDESPKVEPLEGTGLAIRTGETGAAHIVAELDATVVAEESAEESDQRRQAEATGDPVTLPAWAEMTRLEQQSHLYLLHGVYAADVTFGEKLTELHDEAHASDADRVPHVHVAGTVVE